MEEEVVLEQEHIREDHPQQGDNVHVPVATHLERSVTPPNRYCVNFFVPCLLLDLMELLPPQGFSVKMSCWMFAQPATLRPPVITRQMARGRSATASLAFLETEDRSALVMTPK